MVRTLETGKKRWNKGWNAGFGLLVALFLLFLLFLLLLFALLGPPLALCSRPKLTWLSRSLTLSHALTRTLSPPEWRD